MAIETIIGGIILALAMKGAEKLTEKTAEHAFENRSKILDKVKSLLVGEELTTLNLLEKYPENTDLQMELTETLKPKLEANPEIAKELEELLKQIPSIQVKQNTVSQSGTGNISNQDISNSTININK